MTHLELERESVLGKRYLLSLVRHLVAGSIILHVLLEESCTVHSKQNIEHPMAIGLAISSFIKYVQVYALQWQSEKKKKKNGRSRRNTCQQVYDRPKYAIAAVSSNLVFSKRLIKLFFDRHWVTRYIARANMCYNIKK